MFSRGDRAVGSKLGASAEPKKSKGPAETAMSNEEGLNPLEQRIMNAVSDDSIPSIYANGFVNATGTGDVLVVLERNGRPTAKLNLSYTVAKSLAIQLLHAISQFEEIVQRPMLTTEEIRKASEHMKAKRNHKSEEKP